ncbi:alanine racemase [Sphingosinicella sp.]|uniref:alanine racemase n=1 Tax=Sphingosinicella sp. TaxID=1917971 RepID=UPI00403813D3
MKSLADAPTPSLVLDRGRLTRNCARMLAKCRSLGVGLRPHLKTLKSIDAARLAIDPAHGGIAVSTLREAEYFAGHGIADIQYAVCITPDKLLRAKKIAERVPRFSFFLDSVEAARAVAAAAAPANRPFNVWIEIESGGRRTGVDPQDPALVEIATILRDGGIRLSGVATHGGHSYSARSVEALVEIAEEERSAVVAAAERLRAAGFEVPGVSAGSSPTATFMASGEGLTEIRAGVYTAGDLFQAGIGVQDEEDIAVSVLASVIGRSEARGRVVINAGGLALSKDRSTAALPHDLGYGVVVDIDGGASLGRLIVNGVHQEHGEIDGVPPEILARLAVGAKVRVLPNHVCMTAAPYDHYLVVDGGGEIVDRWDKITGW